MRELRAICEPGLVLLGFRPATQLDGLQHVKPASFIYPEENWIKGTSCLAVLTAGVGWSVAELGGDERCG